MHISHLAMALTASFGLAVSAQASNAVVNGGFENLTNGIGQIDNNTQATPWTSNGYNFVFDGTTADSTGSNGQYGGLTLWGPANGVANGLGPSPDGGNFLAADGAFGVAPVQQTITGLTVGQAYVVSFYWAGAQQQGFDGLNTEQWEVSLGSGPSQFTAIYNNPNHGFSGWFSEAFTFTADGSSQVLSFLAHGTPEGVPPFSLLDGVSLSVAAVPEPASWALMIAGFGLVGASTRFRRRSIGSVAA